MVKKIPKRSPKATKIESKVLENATKNTKHTSRNVSKKTTTNLKHWMPKSMNIHIHIYIRVKSERESYDSDGVRRAGLEHLKKRETDLEEILELERRATEFVELASSIQKKSTQCLKA